MQIMNNAVLQVKTIYIHNQTNKECQNSFERLETPLLSSNHSEIKTKIKAYKPLPMSDL